jgi:hypothetical protein
MQCGLWVCWIDGDRFDLTTAKRDLDEGKRRTKEWLANLVPPK